MGRVEYVPAQLPPGATIVHRSRSSAGFGSIIFRMADGSLGGIADPEVGLVNGRHFLEYVEPVKQAKRDGRLDEAAAMLEAIVAMFERETIACIREGIVARPGSTPPWYFEHLAIVYRKLGRYEDEARVLRRFIEIEPNFSDWATERLAKTLSIAARGQTSRSLQHHPPL